MSKKYINNQILHLFLLLISFLEIIICIKSKYAIQYLFIESIVIVIASLIVLIIFAFKHDILNMSTIITIALIIISYIAIILQLYPYFINLIKYGLNYYRASYLFPGIMIIRRYLENITFDRLGSGTTILSLNYYLAWFLILLDFFKVLSIKKSTTSIGQ